MATLTFFGAAGTVTGSRHLLEHDGKRVLVDCGLFQGSRENRDRNWAPQPFDPKSLDAVVLTHAHIDHTGGLPRLVRDGYRGPVFSTSATRELSALMLPDSARIQEEEARYANKHKYSKHAPALPLYEERDAFAALKLFESFGYDRAREIVPGIRLTFLRAGHILGSAICLFELLSTGQRVVFTGDLGRYNAPILRDPEAVTGATTLVTESTYGDREHAAGDGTAALAEAVVETARRGGMLIIPAFAVGRTQDVLYRLGIMEREQRIPELPVYVDSPMAVDATPLYMAHADEHDFETRQILDAGFSPLRTARTTFINGKKQSQALNGVRGPGIIISASGMATGGRVLHHLKHRLGDARNAVLFVGYQAEGTRGRRLLNGEKTLRLLGETIEVRAQILNLSGFSAHADWTEILRWMDGFTTPPAQTLMVHGEPPALEALRARVAAKGWNAAIPRYGETVTLAAR